MHLLQPRDGFALKAYQDFAKTLYQTGILSDAWLSGEERFLLSAVGISQEEYHLLSQAAERIGALYDELATLVLNSPALLDEYFHLTPYQKAMWFSSGGQWHTLARLDLFFTERGEIRCCEMNSDTPSGEAEAVLLNALRLPFFELVDDPNREFRRQWIETIFRAHRLQRGQAGIPVSAGIVYPTEHTEDLSMILCYEAWLKDAGLRVITGSPFNLSLSESGGLTLLSQPIDMMIRHYKTDWWGEREPIWRDSDDFADALPLSEALETVFTALLKQEASVINPLGAVVTQNKRAMAFFFDYFSHFSSASQSTITTYFPKTGLLERMSKDTLITERSRWVLKSNYGCEGAEVLIGRHLSESEWEQSLEMAIETAWIVQEYFEPKGVSAAYSNTNFGVYLCGGKVIGLFTRLSSHATGYGAKTAPTFILR